MKYRYVVIWIMLALQACNYVQDSSHTDAAALYNTQLGLAYLSRGDRVLAKRKLLQALMQAPNLPSANASMAYFMEKTGDEVKAEYYYKKSMLLAPGRGAELNNYGAFLCRRGFYSQSLRYFLSAVNDPQYEHTAAAYENAGLCAMALSNNKKATLYFKKALKQDPLRKQSLYELLRIELKKNQVIMAWQNVQKYSTLIAHDSRLSKLAADVVKAKDYGSKVNYE